MYPFDIPGITRKENGKSLNKFALNKDATNENTLQQLIHNIPPETKVMFYDKNYPSPSDPGAYVSYMRVGDQYIMQLANHGWSTKWGFVSVEELKKYLLKCLGVHVISAKPFEDMFVYYQAEHPSLEQIVSEQELNEIISHSGNVLKESNKFFGAKLMKTLLTWLFICLLLAFIVATLYEAIR